MSEIFDAFFKEVNDSERQKLIDKQNCFLILKGNDLCLRYNMGYNSSANITVPLKLELYSLLKSLCHVLTTRKVFDVLGDREKLNAACRGLADEQLKNQVVYKLCTLIQYGECESLSLKPVILEAMKMAADLYETELHDVTQFFKSRVSDEDWCNLFVIVLGKASPRKGHVALQYFEHLVGDIDIGAKSTNPRKRNRKLCYVRNFVTFSVINYAFGDVLTHFRWKTSTTLTLL